MLASLGRSDHASWMGVVRCRDDDRVYIASLQHGVEIVESLSAKLGDDRLRAWQVDIEDSRKRRDLGFCDHRGMAQAHDRARSNETDTDGGNIGIGHFDSSC